MRSIQGCILLLLSYVMISGCQAEIEPLDPANNNNNNNPSTPGWSFVSNTTQYKGCIDTAYYQTAGTVKTLTVETSDSAANNMTITLVSQTGTFTNTNYTPATGAVLMVTLSNGNNYISASPTSFSINVLAINDTLFKANFTATLTDPLGGGSFNIVNGQITALIGKHNNCNPNPPGGGGGGGGGTTNAVYTLDATMGECAHVLEGAYWKDTALTAANLVKLNVTVTTAGTWSISTNTVNGFKFSGNGTFTAAGPATVTLQGSGTPNAEGTATFPVTAGSSSCSFDVEVDTPAVAPCNPPNNTVNVDVAGISDINIYAVTTTASGGSYRIVGNGTGGDLTLEFAGTSQPQPGVYSIQPMGGSFTTGDVRVSFVSSSIYWQSNTGNLYVTHVNGKVVAVFCGVSFSGSLGGPVFTTLADAKMTEQ